MQRSRAMFQACVAMSTVGGAVTASTYLTDYPRTTAQAARYLGAALVLAAISRRSARWPIVRPVGREWWWLLAAATSGLSVYNLAVVHALDHAEPTVVATVVSGVPLVLALVAPIVAGRRPPAGLVAAAAAVVLGAAIVQGGGRSDLAGVALAALALAGEAAFTLLGVPVLGRLGAFSVATHTSWIAAVQLALLAAATDGAGALPRPGPGVVVAVVYLVLASALAFTWWFLAVESIGGDVAGLTAGVIPVAAVATGVPLGVATVDLRIVAGIALVTVGLIAGLRTQARRDAVSRRVSR